MRRQQGYFLVLAVILILVMAVLGILIAYVFASRARISVAEQQGLQAFYMAESGLEMATRLLTMPNISGSPARITCGSVSGNGALTNASISSGTFTATAINGSPIFATTTLNGAITASATSMTLASTAGFAARGRALIEREAVNYNGISGNTLIGVTRGAGGTTAASHASGAGVGEYLCTIDVRAGIPSLASPSYQRELQWSVPLQNGWAVGNRSGNNFSFNNWNRAAELTWTSSTVAGTSSTRAHLNSVSMLSHAAGWAVGDENNAFTFMRWNGSAWSLNALAGACNNQHLQGISMVSSQEGWAVGVNYRPGCSGGGSSRRFTILKWNGSSWSLLTPSSSPSIPADSSGNNTLNAIHVIDTNGDGLGNIGFAVGNNGEILQYNGSNWVNVTSPVTRNLFGVYTVSSSEAWAVGANGTILRWNGSSWSSVASPTSSQLNAIVMIDTNGNGTADTGWAVGNSGTILTYNGSSWSATSQTNRNLNGVDYFNPNDVWAVGANGTIVHYNGSSWSTYSSSGTNYNAVSLIRSGSNQFAGWQQVFR